MYIRREKGPVFVTMPNGTKLSRSDLPPRSTKRWVARRKAAVVNAVEAGLISPEEACEMYDLSAEELESWQNALKTHGAGALRATSLQKYRQF
ncbi:MAG: DUF1153 domain-containing protein [Pseudomonadota bacterium]